VSSPEKSGAHAAVPLAILESLRHLDAPAEDGTEEFHQELSFKRLGMSETVAAQIERYRRMAGRGGRVDFEEVAALFRLVGRRSDAGLVFADAGRRVGRRLVRGIRTPTFFLRMLPHFAGNGLGFFLSRRAVARILDAQMARENGLPVAVIRDPPSAAATPNGSGCGFYGSALAETLRAMTDFDGALFHPRCRSRGEPVCEWRAAPSRS
jgi:predicted hydrocarbon binding protein